MKILMSKLKTLMQKSRKIFDLKSQNHFMVAPFLTSNFGTKSPANNSHALSSNLIVAKLRPVSFIYPTLLKTHNIKRGWIHDDSARKEADKFSKDPDVNKGNKDVESRLQQNIEMMLKSDSVPDIVNLKGQTPAHVFLETLDIAPFGRDSVRENSIQNLINNMKKVDQIDQDGWSLLHLAVYKQRIKIVSDLLDRGVDPNQTTRIGITPFELAIYRRNGTIQDLLKKFGGKEPADGKYPKLERICDTPVLAKDAFTPHFFADIAMKTISNNQYYWQDDYNGPWDSHTGLYLPTRKSHTLTLCIANMEKLGESLRLCGLSDAFSDVALKQLYWPEELYFFENPLKAEYFTPMGKAIKERDLKQIEYLISEGWNAYIENDFIRGAGYFREGAKVKGFTSCIKDCIKEISEKMQDQSIQEFSGPDFDFAKSVIERMCGVPNTGVTLSEEFIRAFQYCKPHHYMDFNERYAYLIVHIGLTSELFQKQTGNTLNEYLWEAYRRRERDDPKAPFMGVDVRCKILDLIEYVKSKDKNKHKSLNIESKPTMPNEKIATFEGPGFYNSIRGLYYYLIPKKASNTGSVTDKDTVKHEETQNSSSKNDPVAINEDMAAYNMRKNSRS